MRSADWFQLVKRLVTPAQVRSWAHQLSPHPALRNGCCRKAVKAVIILAWHRSSAVAEDSCGAAPAASRKALAARLSSHSDASPSSRVACRSGNIGAQRHEPILLVPIHSRAEDAGRICGRMVSCIVSDQSVHFGRCTAASGRIATQGTRSASATITPWSASLNRILQRPIASVSPAADHAGQ